MLLHEWADSCLQIVNRLMVFVEVLHLEVFFLVIVKVLTPVGVYMHILSHLIWKVLTSCLF